MSGDRVFLVTGATGVVGGAIVERLLAEPRTSVHLLLRAASETVLEQRLQSVLDFRSDRLDRERLIDRVFAVRGDVSLPRLGMTTKAYIALSSRVTNVVHAAGNVKLNLTIDEARRAAVGAADEVLRFASACSQVRSFPKVEYISTVGVAGRRPGLIAEGPIDDAFGYHNNYEQAKAEAETLMRRSMEEGASITFHRPSMVVGDSQDGRVSSFQVFYHLVRFIAGSRTHGLLPRFDRVALDLVPADYVAAVIEASSRRSDSVGQTFHLCSGPRGAILLAELGDIVRKFLEERGERVFTPHYIPRPLMRAIIELARCASVGRTRRALGTLPHFLDYLEEEQLFANDRTAEFFGAAGIEVPPIKAFLGPVLDYWLRHSRHGRPSNG